MHFSNEKTSDDLTWCFLSVCILFCSMGIAMAQESKKIIREIMLLKVLVITDHSVND